jgi:hypothetical protein
MASVIAYNPETGQYAVQDQDGAWKIATARAENPDTGQFAYQVEDQWIVDRDPLPYYEGASEQPDEFDTIESATGDKTGERDWLTGRYEGIKATASNVLGSLAEEVAAPYRSAAGALFEKDPSEVGISVGGADLTGFAEDQFKEGAYHRQEQQERTPEGGAAGFATHALDSMIAMAPAIVTTYATKSPNLGLGVMGVQVFADEYGSVMAEGGERTEALKEAAIQVAFELGPEKAFGFFDNLPGARGLKDWLKQVATEALSEGVTEALNVADEAHRKGEDVGDAVKVAKRLGYASALGATIGGGMSMPALAKGKKQPESPEDWADWSAQLNAQIESEKQKKAAEVERLAKLAKVTEFDVEMDVDAPQGVGVIADTSQIAPPFAPESVIPPEMDPTSPEAISAQQRASDALDQSYETAIERLEPQISPFDTTLPTPPPDVAERLPTKRLTPHVEGVTEGMPRLLDPKTGEPIENPPVTADSSGEALRIPERAQPAEFGFNVENVRDISQPTKTLYADLNALAEELLEIDTMPLDDLITKIQTDMPVDAARYFETDPATGKLFKSPVSPFNLVSRMSTKEVLANMDPEDRLRYHSAKDMDERGMIEAEFRQALKDARKEEAETEFGSTEEMFRDELRRQARQRYEKDDRTLFEMSGRETTDYKGINPEELAATIEGKRLTGDVAEATQHAKKLDEMREDAESIGAAIMNKGIPYLSKPTKTDPEKKDPGWSVIAVEPTEGRVYAQYETKGGGTYVVSWRIGEGYGKVTHARTAAGKLLRENTNKGLETYERPGSSSGAVPRTDSTGEVMLRFGGGLPNDFRQQVDKMAIAAMTSADGVIKTPARGVAGGKVATIPFEGTQPLRFAVREAQRQAVRDANLQADKYNKPTEEDLIRVREKAAKDAAAMQDKVREQLEENTAARGGELVTLPNVKPIKQDLGGKNITLIDQAAKTRLLRSETVEEFATQILPDGSIRTIKLVPNESGTKYKAIATSRGLNKFSPPFEMGDTTLRVNMKKAEEAKAATAKAKRLDIIRTKAMEAQDTDARCRYDKRSQSRGEGRELLRTSAQGTG